MTILRFEVGKRYKFADGRTESFACTLTKPNAIFECCNVDSDGDCWSEDATFMGIIGRGFIGELSRGHCVATYEQLKCGEIVEVSE